MPTCGMAISKFQTIGDKRIDAEVLGQWTHNMVERLTHQHNPLASAHRIQQLFGSLFANLWLEDVMEIFFAQQIQTVQADTTQQRV